MVTLGVLGVLGVADDVAGSLTKFAVAEGLLEHVPDCVLDRGPSVDDALPQANRPLRDWKHSPDKQRRQETDSREQRIHLPDP